MSFFTKLGRKLRFVGEKVTHGIRVVGDKASSFLMGAAPVLTAINPELGAGAAALAGVAKGVSTLSGVAENAIAGRGLDIGQARGAVSMVGSHGAAVKKAYGAASGAMQSALERRK